MSIGEYDLNSAARLVGDLVGRVLYEFEELPVPVAALGDTAFTIGVFRYESGIDRIGLQNARGLLEDGTNDWLLRIGHGDSRLLRRMAFE
jgi:hypothetical protein